MANNPDITESFLAESEQLLTAVRKSAASLSDGAPTVLLRNLHTFKGNARLLGHTAIEKLVHALESVYASVRDGRIQNTDRLVRLVFLVTDRLMDGLAAVRRTGTDAGPVDAYLSACDKAAAGEPIDVEAFAASLRADGGTEEDADEPITDIRSVRIPLDHVDNIIGSFDTMITREFRLKHQLDELRRLEDSTGNHEITRLRKQFEADLFALETAIFGVQEQVFNLRMLPLGMVLAPLESTIAIESLRLGKDVRASIPDTDIAIDKAILEQLNGILLHLVRNALDHGIEPPDERTAAGKAAQGVISITCARESRYIVVTVADDGRGIDYAAVRETALRQYPEREDDIAQMQDRELNQFIFMSGFSTRGNATEVSGRGVGLDAVWAAVEKIKGRIRVESERGRGATFTIRLPLSLSTMQGLFIMSNKDKYLVPSRHIIDVIYRRKDEYITLQNQSYVKVREQLVPVYALSTLFAVQKGFRSMEADSILIAEYMEQKVGIIVDQVIRYVSLVIKPLPPAFKNFSILQGIVFDEHYDIVPILHVPDIIKKFRSLRGYDVKKYEAKTKRHIPRILVVDDSETTRRVEAGVLASGGFQVDTAVDGIDGMEKLKATQYDLILTDRDMPRMDGLVFLENVRRMEQYAAVPVIIVSADQGEEAVAQFKAAGASAFIAKGDFKRGNLISAVQELVHE